MITMKVQSGASYIKKHPKFTGCVIDKGGNKAYFKNGLRHREDDPAVEKANGTKFYFKNGLLHRENGPAIELSDGSESYWLNDKAYSYEKWKHGIMKLKLSRVLKKIDNEYD